MLRLAVGSGTEENGTMLDYRMPVAGSLIGEAIQTGQAIAITDAEQDPHVRSDPRRQTRQKKNSRRDRLNAMLRRMRSGLVVIGARS